MTPFLKWVDGVSNVHRERHLGVQSYVSNLLGVSVEEKVGVATDWIEDEEDWHNMGDISRIRGTEIRERPLRENIYKHTGSPRGEGFGETRPSPIRCVPPTEFEALISICVRTNRTQAK